MTHPTGRLENEIYAAGLRNADETVLLSIYEEFRQPIIRAVGAQGGSDADGAVFFQAGVVEAAQLARADQLPADLPFFYVLKGLSLAQFQSWRLEREQTIPDDVPASPEEPHVDHLIPSDEALQATRRKIYAWKHYASDPTAETPDWAQEALEDAEGYAVWKQSAALEQKMQDSDAPPATRRRDIWPYIMFGLLLLSFAIGLFNYLSRTKAPAEVYDENFTPPESIEADLDARYGPARGNDSVSVRPSECERLLREADFLYKKGRLDDAQEPLLLIVLDTSSICHSDAWFYLGVIRLELDDPDGAIDCFSKIEDLDAFGEDIYWYQALAFVKMAEHNPGLKSRAERAMQRALGNMRDSTRRKQAEKMLKNLSD